jgi:hypothetical protein
MLHEINESTIATASTLDLQRAFIDLETNWLSSSHAVVVTRGKELITKCKCRPNWQEPESMKVRALESCVLHGRTWKQGEEGTILKIHWSAWGRFFEPLETQPDSKANSGKL